MISARDRHLGAVTAALLLACLPVQSATLLMPDMRDEPTPMVPFSAISITCLSGCCSFSASISCCARSEIRHLQNAEQVVSVVVLNHVKLRSHHMTTVLISVIH